MAKTEKQVKYKINNFDYISKRLIEIEAIFIGGFMEKTIRYDNDDLKCSNNGIFIRTKSGMKNVLTLKEIPTDSSKTSFERITTEIEVDNINKIGYILEKIGLTKKFIMEKYRLFFKYDNVDILIDELPFGIYLEIKGEDNEINRVTKILNIDETDLIKMTYWDIYDKIKKDSKNENIVFETNHIFKIATYL
mgnify:FL=1